MPQTVAVLLPIFQLLAAPAVAGALASWFINKMRTIWPLPLSRPSSWPRRLFYRALYAPLYVRFESLALAAAIGVIGQSAIALLSGGNVLAAADLALAAALSAVSGQLIHGWSLKSTVQVPDPTPIGFQPRSK